MFFFPSLGLYKSKAIDYQLDVYPFLRILRLIEVI